MKFRAPALKRPRGDTNGTNSCRKIMKHGSISSLRQLIPKWEPGTGRSLKKCRERLVLGYGGFPGDASLEEILNPRKGELSRGQSIYSRKC